MQIGDQDLGLGIVVLFGLLIVALIGNILLFFRGHSSYSVKYEIFMKSPFFRTHPSLCQAVEVIYHLFFAVPFILLLIIAIIRATVNGTEFFTIIFNGLIVLLTIYPMKHLWFYRSKLLIWLLVIASQLNTLYQHLSKSSVDSYTLLSSIFYPINSILFSLAALAHQQDYWQIDQAISLCEDELKQIYPQFTKPKEEIPKQNLQKEEEGVIEPQQQIQDSKIEPSSKVSRRDGKRYNIPDIFDGGIYGILCRERGNRGKNRAIIYGISLAVLGLNAYLVWLGGSSLGVIGLITNFIYDIFIFAFSGLNTSERSVRNIFLLIFLGRMMSFVFGQSLWIFGYCILYLIVGIFIGRIIINTRLPLKKVKKSKAQRLKREQKNALKTPQFVLFILTAEVFLLVLAASFNVGGANVSYSYSTSISVPLWQFALIAVMVTWIIIIFMGSFRMYQRECNNIKESPQYYFGVAKIRTFHISMTVTYLLVVGLGFYCYYFLNEATAFLSCIFLPLILLALIKLEHEWVKNEYQLLADIKEHNERVVKAKKVILKKKQALSRQPKDKRSSAIEPNKLMIRTSKEQNNFESSKTMLVMEKMQKNDNLSQSETSTQMEQQNAIKEELKQLTKEDTELVQLEYNWRTFQGKIGLFQFFTDFLTPSDKWILAMILTLIVLFTAYVVSTYVVANTIFGMLIVLSLIALLSFSPFYRFSRTFRDLTWPEYVEYYSGFLCGIVYWCFYRKETAFVMVWSGWYILCGGALIIIGLFRNIHKNYIYLLIGNIAATIVFICVLLFFTVEVVFAALVTVVLCMLAVGAIPVAYNYIEGNPPLAVKLICGGVIVLGVVGVAVAGWITDIASNLAVFSFVMGAIYVVLFLMASIMFYNRQDAKYQTPHVYSAYGKPIYKFQSRVQQLKSSLSHKVIYQLGGIVLVIYAAVVTIIFSQKQYAIYALGFFSCTAFLEQFLFALKTHNQLALQRSKITKELVAKALRELNTKYMVDFHSNAYSKEVEKEKYKLKEKAETAVEEELNQSYRDLARKHEEYIKNSEQQQKFLFFWTALIEFQLFTQKKASMVKLINQVKQIEAALMDLGIFIESVNYNITDFVTKYELITQEIDSLDPFDFINYQTLLANHQKLSIQRNEEQKKLAEAIEKEQKQKENKMFEQLQKEMKKSGNQKINQFNALLNQIQPKKKFVDNDFPASEESLGGSLNSIVQKWRRPKRGETLVKDGFSAYDIKQGDIGDCYLISSMGVLGERWIRAALGGCKAEREELSPSEWRNQKGAYMIKFNKFLKDVYIIVDDQIPVDNHDNFVFAKSEDPEEIWPSIVEKAYAKLYGGYNNIVSGKCHRVFAEFTGGFPSELLTEDYKANPNSFWQRILTARENQYLMAAGSPSHAEGDKAHSSRGIVQGHAYAILQAKEVQGHKLMQLKNPHGSGGIEWSGDFSDDSELMTKRLMQLLEHENKEDGIFWMCLQDFLHEFKSLYLCAIFDQQSWLEWPTIESKFTEENSFGVPTSSEETFKNPQYGITVTKKCTFFVNMVQQAENSLEGKNVIYLRIQRNSGKRITKHNTRTELLCGKQLRPINAINLANEAVLEADSYPYTFTLYLSCKDEGDEGDFKLQIYCSDKDMKVIPDAEFDRQLFSK